jgi:hypothetical protein
MVDNVLLEKRNRYLGKLIKKTQNLTESVKLLSIIDKQLYSQSDGYSQAGGFSFGELAGIWNKNINTPRKIGGDHSIDINMLTEAIKKLEETAKLYNKGDASYLANSLQGITPVIYHELEDIGINIKGLIDRLNNAEVLFTNFELKQAIELFKRISAPAKAYSDAAAQYKVNPTEAKLSQAVKDLYTKLDTAIKEIKSDAPSYELFKKMVDLLYARPPDRVMGLQPPSPPGDKIK